MYGDTQSINDLKKEIMSCKNCNLCKIARAPVISRGSYKHKIMIIGEGPGSEEDRTGKPFCGPAGRLLEDMTEKAGLSISQCYLTNVVKCKPFEQYTEPPTRENIEACLPYLKREILLLRPILIIAVGLNPAYGLIEKLNFKAKMKDLNGELLDFELEDFQSQLVCLYHPSYILRQKSSYAEECWIKTYKEIITMFLAIENKIYSVDRNLIEEKND